MVNEQEHKYAGYYYSRRLPKEYRTGHIRILHPIECNERQGQVFKKQQYNLQNVLHT